MNQNEYYTLPNAMAKLGVTYKTIRYYAEHELFANDESLVKYEGKKKWVSEKFIEKVRHNLETNSSRFRDPRTKEELIREIERLNGLYDEALKKIDALENEDPYELAENERLEVFTNEEYALFEERLKEWATLQREIQLKDESFKVQLNSKEEIIEHYKHQFEYQRQLAERQLDQMDKLLGYLKDRNLREAERAQIEAVEKRVIPRQDGYDPYGSTQR